MFWNKGDGQKLHGPQDIPELVGRYLVTELKKDPDWVWRLKCVTLPDAANRKKFQVRVFDSTEADRQGVKVKDYTSFNEHLEALLYEGWFDKGEAIAQVKDTRAK